MITKDEETPNEKGLNKEPNSLDIEPNIRGKIREEVLKELEIEKIKKDILAELGQTKKDSLLERIIKHPAFLVILGFILTGVITNILKSSWDKKEWNRQLARQIIVKKADKKYEIIDDINKELSKSNAKSQAFFFYIRTRPDFDVSNPQYNSSNNKKLHAWVEGRDEWDISSQTIEQNIAIYFSDPNIRSIFKQIIKDKLELDHNILSNLMLKGGNREEQIDAAEEIMQNININHKKLVEAITAEIQKDLADESGKSA